MTKFRNLRELSKASARGESVVQKVNACVLVSIETALDFVPAANGAVLVSASRNAKHVHDALGGFDESVRSSPAYLAGCMAALADLLELAAQRCVAPDFAARLRQDKYADMLRALAGTRMRNVDLAGRTGTNAASVCRKLRELKGIGAVVSSPAGRDVYNALSPAAEAIVNAGLVPRRTSDERLFEDARRRGGDRLEGPPTLSAAPNRAPSGVDV